MLINVSGQTPQLREWLESVFAPCEDGTPLKELHQFIKTRCPVGLKGVILSAEDSYTLLQQSFPTAVHHDSGEENLYPFSFKV